MEHTHGQSPSPLSLLRSMGSCLLLALFLLTGAGLHAQTTRTSVATGNWSTASTWSPTGVPAAGDNVIIDAAHTVSLTANVTITGSLTVDGTLDLTHLALTAGSLSGPGTILGNQLIVPGVGEFNAFLRVGSNNTSTTFSGTLNGPTTILSKVGTGTLTLSGANTYGGETRIEAGTIRLGAANRLSDNTDVLISANGTLDLNGFDETLGGLRSFSPFNPGPWGFVTNSSPTFATLTIQNIGTELRSVISGNINLVLSGNGGSITGANTYTGTTLISGGLWNNLPYNGSSPSIFGNSPTVTLDGPNTTFNVASLYPISIGGTLKIQNGATMWLFAPVSAASLELDGVPQTPGTYGSTISPATNQLDQYFTNTFLDDPEEGPYTVAGPEVLTVVDYSNCPMVIEVVTTAPNQTVTLPLSGIVNARVQWGDGDINFYAGDADQDHTYAAAGTYTINISGVLTQFGNGTNPNSPGSYANADKITRVLNWGCTGLTSLFAAFRNATNLVQLPADFPPTVTATGHMLRQCDSFNQDISTWDVSNVTSMRSMFEGNNAFNQNIGAWNVSNVTNMSFMFVGATAFNNGGSPSIGNWNTASATTFRAMFFDSGFDQAIGNWPISTVNDFRDMFNSSRLSHCNYNATLIGWAAQPGRQTGRIFHGGTSRYNTGAAAAARAALTNAPSSWTITDGGVLNWSLTSAAGTDNQNVAVGTPITTITYAFDGGETAVFSGLPPGVTGTVSGGVATISGTPTAGGLYTYSVDACGVLTGTIGVCSENVVLEIQTGSTPDALSWEIEEIQTSTVVLSGNGANFPPSAIFQEQLCLAPGCYKLRLIDSADGATGYQLRRASDQVRLIDNFDNFNFAGTSEITGNTYSFCIPVGSNAPIYTSCDKEFWRTGEFVVAAEDPDVSSQWIVGGSNNVQSASTGYEFWFFNPNGGYSFRRFRSHNQSDGFGNVGATRACHMRVNNWTASQHIPEFNLHNVRIRARVNGVNKAWGPACRFVRNEALAQCPPTKLMDIPGNQFLSCNQFRQWNVSGSRIHARPVSGANLYQWRFRIPAENVEIIRTSTSYFLNLNWTALVAAPLETGKTYEVDVRASRDGGTTWCGFGGAPWGDICSLTIGTPPAVGGNQNMSLSADGVLAMWPNPNNGTEVWISLDGIDTNIETVTVDIHDLTGKRISARILPTQDGSLYTALPLNGDLATGIYTVTIIAGEAQYVQRLVIQN